MYPNVSSPTAATGAYQIHDDNSLILRVNASRCWLYWVVGGVASIVVGTVFLVLSILTGENFWDPAFRLPTMGVIFLIIGLGTQYMIIEGDEEKIEVTYGPCSAYQKCLLCGGGCCNRPLPRGLLRYEHIQSVATVSGDCRDGFGAHKRKWEPTCVHNVICCPTHVVEVHQQGGPTGCCGAGSKIRYGVATHEQAVELQTFLVSKMPDATGAHTNNGTFNGSVNNVQPSAPPSYDSIPVAAYTLPPSTSFE